MEPERNEVYERIPWETLDRPAADRQWLIIAVAGAIAVGALAFSFVRGQPVAPPPSVETVPTAAASVPQPAPGTTQAAVPAPPMVVSEEDLYALDAERLATEAAAHAEWFVVEYLTVDGSETSRQTLGSMLPAGVPLPEAPDGTQVFVDWVGARSVLESGPLTYLVEVTARSLLANGDAAFVRQPPTVLEIEVTFGDDGSPRVALPPKVVGGATATQAPSTLAPVPEELAAQIEASHGRVIGGELQADGTWLVVAMTTAADGVTRPVTVASP